MQITEHDHHHDQHGPHHDRQQYNYVCLTVGLSRSVRLAGGAVGVNRELQANVSSLRLIERRLRWPDTSQKSISLKCSVCQVYLVTVPPVP